MARVRGEDTETPVVMRGPGGDDGYDYLLLSDVHLGSDLVPHVRPWAATSWLLEEAEIDARLVTLLAYYRDRHAPERRFRLILVGDFLDLVGVSLSPAHDRAHTPLTREEERHGLGSAPDHVVQKVEAIAARHPAVFEALYRFVAAGHELVVVRGNHDIELHWRAAQRALLDAVLAHAEASERDVIARSIRICPWFYAVEGLLYAEHGHEFDPMCSYGDPLLPTCPRDSRRIRETPFSVLLRHIARPTRGLSSAAYDYVGMGAYARLLGKLGVSGSAQIAVRYARASRRLLRECFARARDDGKRHVTRAQAALRRFAEDTGIAPARLEALRALYVAPAAHSVDFVARSLYLDRLLSLMVASGLALSALLLVQPAGLASGGLCALPVALLAGYACIGRGSNTRPQASMLRGAEAIGALFETRWVLMGHTHRPTVEPAGAATSYVNLGCWGQDDPPDERLAQHASPCTYFLIRREGDAYVGALMRWDAEAGPQPTEHAPESVPVALPSA